MKKALLGIDELTILEPTASGGGGGSGGGIGGDLGLDLPEYDFLAGLEEQASKIKEQMESILGPILSIGAGFAAWKITPKVLNWFKDLKNGKFSKIDKLAAGIGLVITGFTLEWQGGYDIGYNGLNLENAIKTAIGAGLGIAGSLLIFGTGPLGWTIGIVAALSVAIASITIKYQTDGNYEEYTAAIENEMQTYFANQAQVSATAFEPLIGKFNAAFSDALTEAQPAFDRPVEDLLDRTFHQFTTDETGVLVGDSISDFMRSVDQQWKLGFQTLDITPEVRAALSETLAALEPRAEQLQKIADDSRAAGIAVPQYVSEGLHDYNMLAAISGDMDAINYLLGEKLSTDPNFLQALQTATDAGMNINEAVANGLLDNLEVKENADGTISLINDTIGEKVLEVTPALKETLKTLGINMSNGLIEGVESKDTEVFNSANGIGKQVGNGIADGLDDSTRAVKNAADRLVDIALSATKTAAKIHSPSRLFRDEVGLNIGLGISEGIGNSRDAILSEIELTNQRMVSAFSTGSIGSLSRSFSVEEVKSINTHTSGTVTVTDGREGQREINQEMISTLFAISQQIISAIEENSGDVYLDGDKVGERVTEYQNRKNRIFGR